MKAVIVDLQGERAAVLCEDGSIRDIPDAGYLPGQTLELPGIEICAADERSDEIMPSANDSRKRRRSRPRWGQIAGAAAACFLTLGIGAGTVWATPYGKVYMESGSSLAYTINYFDYVLEVDADDQVGQEILEELDLTRIVHKKIDRAVEQTLEQMDENRSKTGNKTPETSAEKAAADPEEKTVSHPVDDGEIEIVTEIRNEKHARKLKERLGKIAEKAVRTSPSQTEDGELPQESAQAPADVPADAPASVSEPDADEQEGLPGTAEQKSEAAEGAKENSKENTSSERSFDSNSSLQEDSDLPASGSGNQVPADGPGSDSGSRIPDSAGDTAPSGSPGQLPAGGPGQDSGGQHNDGGSVPGGSF